MPHAFDFPVSSVGVAALAGATTASADKSATIILVLLAIAIYNYCLFFQFFLKVTYFLDR
jgi:hypothetical protein